MRTVLKVRISNLLFPMGKALAIVTSGAFYLLLPASTSAQGCAMCNANASAAKQAGIQALQNGILILLVPCLLMFAGVFYFAFRRHSEDEDEGTFAKDTSGAGTSGISPEIQKGLRGETVFPNSLDSNRIEETGFQTHIRE